MSVPFKGVTAKVIGESGPPYQLSADLLEATLAAMPPPPADAPASWRQARIEQLIEEITAFKPVNAAEAAAATDIVTVRAMADFLAQRAYEAELTVPEACRMQSVVGEMVRTVAMLMRMLRQSQQRPGRVFGDVVDHGIDVVALAKAWRNRQLGTDSGQG